MASAEDPKAESQIVFPAGVSEVRCAFELDKNELNAGDSYSLNVVNSAGAVVAKADLIGVGAQDRAAVRFFGGTHFRPMMGQPSDISDATLFDVNVPVKAEGGTLLKGDYLSNITFNGKMKGSIDWSVAP
jgi:hypothetical protein